MMSTGLLAVLCLHCLAVVVWSSDDDNCGNDIDGGRWLLVRHTYNKWFQAADGLVGTAEYGTDCGPLCDDEFSIPFTAENTTEFLFSSGDCDRWMITTYDQFVYEKGSNYPATILKSHISDVPYTALWYHRAGVLADPWISYQDHWDEDRLTNMYAGNHATANPAFVNSSMNVWIRVPSESPTSEPTTSPSAQPTSDPTRDCSVFHIDEFLMDCSVEFDGHDTDIKALQDEVSTLQEEVSSLKDTVAQLVTATATDSDSIDKINDELELVTEALDRMGDWP